MREIKFRAWDKEEQEMHQWEDLIPSVDLGYLLSNELGEYDEYEIMQYTGQKDKNGVEIYEGDILEFEDTGEEGYEYLEGYDFTNRAAVCYENGRFELENFVGGDGYVLESMSHECHEDFMIILNNSKIIGNRYENPELLEESHANKTSNR